MVLTSLKTPLEALRFPPTWLPEIWRFGNYFEVFQEISFLRYFLNTVFITLMTLFGIFITGVLAAYAFARIEFWGRETLFMIFLALMMIPLPVYLVPSYMILYKLGWIDTYWAMIVPWMVNIFSIFFLRQHIKTLPQDLFDAAKIDGVQPVRHFMADCDTVIKSASGGDCGFQYYCQLEFILLAPDCDAQRFNSTDSGRLGLFLKRAVSQLYVINGSFDLNDFAFDYSFLLCPASHHRILCPQRAKRMNFEDFNHRLTQIHTDKYIK